MLDRLIRALARGEIRPRARLLLLFANPAAMRRTLRQVDHDLNRLFRGAHADVWGSEAIRAAELEALVSSFFGGSGRQRRHYDLHSAMRPSRLPQFAICPWREDQQAPAEALARLQGLAIDGVLLQRQATPTFTALTAMRHGAEAFTLELAESGVKAVHPAVLAFETGLIAMIEGRTLPVGSGPSCSCCRFPARSSSAARGSGCVCRRISRTSTPLPLGSLLAEDEAARWVVDEPGARILFPWPMSPKWRAALIVVPLERLEAGQ